jgi:hypothetical protein
MRKMTRMAALIAALICTSVTAAAATPGEFYGSLLRRGVAAFDAGRFDEATQHLRLAAFGLIENIEQYQTAHAYLAATYDRTGQSDRAQDSVRRIAQAERVEARFASLKLPAPVRATVEKLAGGVLTPSEVAGLRGAAAMPPRTPAQAPPTRTTTTTTTTNPPVTVDQVQVEEVRAATATTTPGTTTQPATTPATTTTAPATTTPGTTTQPATTQPRGTTTTTAPATTTPATTTQPATTTPATTTPAPATTTQGTTTQPVTTTPANTRPAITTPAPATTTAPTPPTTTIAAPATTTTPTTPTPRPAPTYTPAELAVRFAAAERALNTSNLAEARRIYSELLASQNLDRTTAIRIAEGFYRARHFAGALAAFDRAGGLRRTEEPYRYYVAVALYETGQYERARRELAAALPYIEITPDVARYRAKIQSAIQ